MTNKPAQIQTGETITELLQKSSETWRELTSNSPNYFLVVEPDGVIRFANRPFAEQPVDKLLGRPIYDFLSKDDARTIQECINITKADGASETCQLSIHDKAGQLKRYATSTHAIYDDGKIIALVIESRDISEQLNYKLLNKVISHSPIVMWALDKDGVFTLSEGLGLESLGLKPGEVVGQSIFDIYADYPEILDDIRRALAGEVVTSVRTVANRIYHSQHSPLLDKEGNVKTIIGVANDITESKQAQQQHRLLSSALEQTADLVMITDVHGNIEYVNPAFEKITGYSREEAIGRKPGFLHSGKQDTNFYKDLWDTIMRGDVYHGIVLNKRKDGSHYYEEKTITPLLDNENNISYFIATGKDISERMRTQERLHYMAHHDSLTKLPNRTLFLDRLRQAMARARWHNRLVAVMFIDLDRFKNINDTLGHNIGDQLLIQLTQRLDKTIRAGDTIARFGGDEFAVLLDDIASEKDVSHLAKKLLDTLAPVFHIEQHEFFITASIGVSIFPNDGDDSDTLLRNADVAMYRAKDMGRNNYQFYSNEMSARAFERLTLENSLRHALKREEFFLLYQPQVSVKDQKIIGVEALLRWQHPDLGVVSPTEFVPLLEETGLIVDVGDWVLRTACEQARQWHNAGFDFLKVSVNLSVRQFNNPDFNKSFHEILQQYQISPETLELELTESMLMRNASRTISTLNSLNQLGVRFAVDDFGTGYSSLNYLRRFPISTLKIDRSFIRDVVSDQDDAAITSAIIVMAQRLNLNVIAEGVETEAQLELLRTLNCDQVQGYLFSTPVPACSIEKLLSKQSSG
jgi:diguanylate cyclase (GGDEF)-like protein/PAS domain S-box-containing protein